MLRRIIHRIQGLGRADGGEVAAVPPQAPQKAPAREPSAHAAHAATAVVSGGRPAQAPESPRRGPERQRPPEPAGSRPERAPAWDIGQFQVVPVEGKTRFHDLNLPPEIMHGIADLGFKYCTPIQAALMPALLAGRDAAGQAQTGTGKTAAFLISMFTRFLSRPVAPSRRPGTPRALVLAPTRELAVQVEKEAAELGRHCRFDTLAVYGGMDYDKQRRHLQSRRVDLVVATPGRLLDYLRQRALNLGEVEILVVDEADRMLDMGFIPDVRRILQATPPSSRRQTSLFSATLSPDVMRLASQWMREAVTVKIEPEQIAPSSVKKLVYIVTAREKFPLLYHLLTHEASVRALVFANRRDEAERLADRLAACGVSCALMSGDVPQEKRMRRMEEFRAGRVRVLVATDVAGRGIHVDNISHVINYHLPQDPESYVHRIGRTGRAGETGVSISFACEDEAFALPEIEKFIGEPLTYLDPEPQWLAQMPEGPQRPPRHRGPPPPRRGGPSRRRR